jgi:hypothetical protein
VVAVFLSRVLYEVASASCSQENLTLNNVGVLQEKAEIYMNGACLTSYVTGAGYDVLFRRPDAVFDGSKPISGPFRMFCPHVPKILGVLNEFVSFPGKCIRSPI